MLHSGRYEDGEAWKGKNALVIGTGNSGHDIAQDLHSAGANVTLVQRSPTLIVNIEPSAQLAYALYDEGPPLEDCDLITVSVPLELARKSHQRMTAHCKQLDKDLLDRLARIGFKLSDGEDGTGWQFHYLTRGGGYYFNVGCSDLIADGKVGAAAVRRHRRLHARGRAPAMPAKLMPLDLVVMATGYKGQEALVRKLFGEQIADARRPHLGLRRHARNCATCSCARRSRACGSSPAASPSAASTPSISPCRSRRGELGLVPAAGRTGARF